MNLELREVIKKKLEDLVNKGCLENKCIVIFGYNSPGDFVIEYLRQKGINVEYVLDNNPLNLDKILSGVKVKSPNILLEVKMDVIVLIASRYFEEMKTQLDRMKTHYKKEIIKLVELNNSAKNGDDLNAFYEKVDSSRRGIQVLKRANINFDKKVFVSVNPIKANGDIYILSSYINEYLAKNQFDDYVIFVIGDKLVEILKSFNIENVVMIDQEEMSDLVCCASLLNKVSEKLLIKITQPYYCHTYLFRNIDGYSNLHFSDYYKLCLLKLDQEVISTKPKIDKKTKEYEKELANNKSVIIAPYSNSLPNINNRFWEILVQKFLDKGYLVLTNAVTQEEAIKGTKHINFKLSEVVKMCELCGAVISARSGFSDISAHAECKNVVIYPDKACGYGKVIDVYSIKGLSTNRNILEIEYIESNIEDIIETIMKHIDKEV